MVEQELSHFEEYGCDIEYPSECYSMLLVIENIEPEHETRLEELCQIILQVILHG